MSVPFSLHTEKLKKVTSIFQKKLATWSRGSIKLESER